MALERDADGVTVQRNGKLFTRYLIKSGTKPILWPIIGPFGDEITRQHPMRLGVAGERADHPHQRLVVVHPRQRQRGQLLGREPQGRADRASGIRPGRRAPVPTIVTRNDWVAPDGKRVCEDERRIAFGGAGITCGSTST